MLKKNLIVILKISSTLKLKVFSIYIQQRLKLNRWEKKRKKRATSKEKKLNRY